MLGARELDQFAINQELMVARISDKTLKFSKFTITEKSVGLLVGSLNSSRIASLIIAQCIIDKPLEAFTSLVNEVPSLRQLRIEGMWFESDTNIDKKLLKSILDKRAIPLAVHIVGNYSLEEAAFSISTKVRKARDGMEIRQNNREVTVQSGSSRPLIVLATERNEDFDREYFVDKKKKKPRQNPRDISIKNSSAASVVTTKQAAKFVAYVPKNGGVSWADQFADDEPVAGNAISSGR